ncbi:MAG: YggS family pyridoxal phosphate-dependent enzyme [Peptostreptococcaceae bacterium]|nr:YggS family pyridoxal phosphate-dependent enzyme [Peptostreptococcaceae bacterium]
MGEIAGNIEEIRRNIENIMRECGRTDEITLIAVSKTVGAEAVMEAVDAGVTDLGENKVQEIEKKYPQICRPVRWHLIGSLQTNKVKYIIDKTVLIHSLDRISLAEEIDRRAKQKGIIANCLVQINISQEDSKHGVEYEAAESFVEEVLSRYENIKIEGLMGMAPFELDAEDTRPYFRKMKELFDRLSQKEHPRLRMRRLSMGMSGDYEVALQEGSNMIRIGTSIFGQRNYSI